MMLTDLAEIARSTGHPVTEVPGWKTRSRPSTPWGLISVQTITIHETGLDHVPTTDMPSLDVLINGRDGPNPVPGPLSQFGIGMSGRIYVVAAGLCNHAGESLLNRYTREHAIGLELESSGHGLPGDFPKIQLDAAARLAAALKERYSAEIRGHKETCAPVGRKVDPHFSMPDFRGRATRLAGTRLTTEDDDMAEISKEQIAEIATAAANAVWARAHKVTEADARAYGTGVTAGQRKSADEIARFPPAIARLRRENAADIGALTGLVTALAARLDAALLGGGLTEAQAAAAAERGSDLSLDELRRRILLTDVTDDNPVP